MHASTTLEQTRSPLPIRTLNRCGAWLEKIDIPRTPLLPAELIDAAKRRCGLSDFGKGDFFEPLSRLLESCHREARLNLVGKIALRCDLVRTLCNRLSIEQDRHLYPEIARQEIHAPLFIVGLPRSGTTLLHTLLAADSAHRAPLTWEVMSPSPPTNQNQRRRIQWAAKNLSSLQWLAPTFRRVHALGAELPQECVGLMSPTLLSDQFDTMFYVPSYRFWFLKQSLLPAYEYHRRFLQHLQHRQSACRWVLKAPVHMFALPTLLSIYPDALFVHVHRDPLEAIASVSSMIAILRGVFSNAVNSVQIGRDALHYWSETMATFLREREHLSSQRICDVGYLEIRRDPIAAVRRVYEHFDWRFAPETEQRMRSMLSSQPREQNGFHHYEPAQFGLEAAEATLRFPGYCERFGLLPQVATRCATVGAGVSPAIIKVATPTTTAVP